MHWRGFTALFVLVAPSLVRASCPSIPPPVGLSCSHVEEGVRLTVYYGDDIWYHAWNIAQSDLDGVDFGIATKEERDNRRKEETDNLERHTGWARDEKPLARMSYTGHAYVCLLPDRESSKEGGYTNSIPDFEEANKGKPVALRVMDNRSSKTQPPRDRGPFVRPVCHIPAIKPVPTFPNGQPAGRYNLRSKPWPTETRSRSPSPAGRHHKRDELLELGELATRTLDDDEYPELNLLERRPR